LDEADARSPGAIHRDSSTTLLRVEVITSVERRRRWSRVDKERLVAASFEPGANVSAIARRAGVHSSQLFRWRRQFATRPDLAPSFSAVMVKAAPVTTAMTPAAGLIEVEFASARVKIAGAADPATVSAVVGTLAGGRQ
jgi:transposase